jgi:hypothetical protein
MLGIRIEKEEIALVREALEVYAYIVGEELRHGREKEENLKIAEEIEVLDERLSAHQSLSWRQE